MSIAGPREGTWRIRENGGKFHVECWERYYSPVTFISRLGWYGGRYRFDYPVTDTLKEAETWIDERLHPDKYNRIIGTYEPST